MTVMARKAIVMMTVVMMMTMVMMRMVMVMMETMVTRIQSRRHDNKKTSTENKKLCLSSRSSGPRGTQSYSMKQTVTPVTVVNTPSKVSAITA